MSSNSRATYQLVPKKLKSKQTAFDYTEWFLTDLALVKQEEEGVRAEVIHRGESATSEI